MSSGVEFEEDKISYTPQPKPAVNWTPTSGPLAPTINRNDPKMVQWLMRKGIARSPAAAQGILVAIILLNILITYFVVTYIL